MRLEVGKCGNITKRNETSCSFIDEFLYSTSLLAFCYTRKIALVSFYWSLYCFEMYTSNRYNTMGAEKDEREETSFKISPNQHKCSSIHEKCLFHIIPFMYLRLIAFVLQIKIYCKGWIYLDSLPGFDEEEFDSILPTSKQLRENACLLHRRQQQIV